MQTTPTPLPTPAFITADAAKYMATFKSTIAYMSTTKGFGSLPMDTIRDMCLALPSARGVIRNLGDKEGTYALRLAISAMLKDYIDSTYMPKKGEQNGL